MDSTPWPSARIASTKPIKSACGGKAPHEEGCDRPQDPHVLAQALVPRLQQGDRLDPDGRDALTVAGVDVGLATQRRSVSPPIPSCDDGQARTQAGPESGDPPLGVDLLRGSARSRPEDRWASPARPAIAGAVIWAARSPRSRPPPPAITCPCSSGSASPRGTTAQPPRSHRARHRPPDWAVSVDGVA